MLEFVEANVVYEKKKKGEVNDKKMRSEDKRLIWRWRESFIIRMPYYIRFPDTYFERTADEALRSDVYAEIFLFECETKRRDTG